MRVILASTSPRRRELIGKIRGLTVTVVCPDVDEATALNDPVSVARTLAETKARAVSKAHPNIPVIGADTVVAVGDMLLGKPLSSANAAEMLRMLSNRAHMVITGVCVCDGVRTRVDHAVSTVRFAPLPEAFIEAYIDGGKPMDKAGAYGLQDGELAPFVLSVAGERDNVIGLPVRLLKKMLKEFESNE